MSEDIKLEIIRTTQDSLSKYIKKPPLTEKLLRKPPFRYLHDITTAVMRETGYLQGLYSQEELNPENIKDREAKIAFLEKLIAAVNLSTGVHVAAKPNKIVAGLDVAKTNELLQIIAKALEKKIDGSKAVEQVLNKKSKGVNQQNSAKKETSKSKTSKDAKPAESKSREPRTSDTLKKKSKDKIKSVEKTDNKKAKPKKDASPTKLSKRPSLEEHPVEAAKDDAKSQQEIPADASLTADSDKPTPTQSVLEENQLSLEPKHDVKPPPSPPSQLQEPQPTVDQSKEQAVVKEDRESSQEPKAEPTKEVRDHGKENTRHEEEMRRPQSARAVHRKKPGKKPSTDIDSKSPSQSGVSRDETPATQVPVSETNELIETRPAHPTPAQNEKRPRTAARPASARPGAPRLRDRGTVQLPDNDNKVVVEPVNLIVDSRDLPKDDDDTLVTVEAAVPQVVEDQVEGESNQLVGDQGHLVTQILETQKELEDTTLTSTASEAVQKVDISWGSGRQEAVAREVDKLRTAIQSVTRAANPLGKLIDFLQEDIDSMQTELETWAITNQQLAAQLQAEQRLTEESIEPLARQLEDINQLVEEQLEEMSVVKAAIIRNDERLSKLLETNTPHLPG